MLCQVFRRVDYLLHSTVKQPTVQHCRPTILGGWPSNTCGLGSSARNQWFLGLYWYCLTPEITPCSNYFFWPEVKAMSSQVRSLTSHVVEKSVHPLCTSIESYRSASGSQLLEYDQSVTLADRTPGLAPHLLTLFETNSTLMGTRVNLGHWIGNCFTVKIGCCVQTGMLTTI